MTIRQTLLTLGLAAATAGAALAAAPGTVRVSVEGEAGAERVLDEAEIRAFTTGKTFHYTLMGLPRGEEQHHGDGRATWRLPDGTCMHGIWVARGEVLCYYYGALRYGCWNVVEDADGYRHAPLNSDGTPGSGPSVFIDRVSEEPVGCAPQQLASLSP